MPHPAAPSGSSAISANVPARTNGSTWYVARSGTRRATAANPIRPTVTIPQNAVSASAACVVDAPSLLVMSSCDQLPFTVSQIP